MMITAPHKATTTAQLIEGIQYGDKDQSREALETLARKEAYYMAANRDRAVDLLDMVDQWTGTVIHAAITRTERWMTRPLTLDEKRRFATEMSATLNGLV